MKESSDSRRELWMQKLTGRAKVAQRLRNSTAPLLVGAESALTRNYGQLTDLPGWFNLDDAAHFQLVSQMQQGMGVSGDVLEIGPYFGRSTAFLATLLADGERLVVCDPFDGGGSADHYPDTPTPQDLRAAVARLQPGLSEDRLAIHQCLSTEPFLDPDDRFRLVHIDGGHGYDTVLSDLALAWSHLCDHGVVVVDDYGNASWPEVSRAVDDWLPTAVNVRELGDLNRHGAAGRKLYLMKLSAAD